MRKDSTRDYATQAFISYAQHGRRGRQEIADAVRAVYFISGIETMSHRDIKNRVRAHAMAVPADERTVYRWLQAARELFAIKRGLAQWGKE